MTVACLLTIVSMTLIARKMQRTPVFARPGRVQTVVEGYYDLIETDHQRQPHRRDGPQVVPVPRDAVPLHLVLEHARLPAAADEHRAQGRHLRPRDPVVRALRGDREHLGPARPHLRRRGSATTSRASGPRARSSTSRAGCPPGVEGPAVDPDLRHRGDLALRADRQPLRPTVRQHPRRPPADPVHGRRPGRPAEPRDRRLGGPRPLTGTIAFAFFIFEVGLVATLQAFIFTTLTAIYLGGAVAEEH